MKFHIIFPLLFLFGTSLIAQEPTALRQQEEDYIQLGLSVKAEGSSLVNAMGEALKIANNIKRIATQFCQAHAKKKSDCKDIVQIGKYDIDPKYQVVKRQSKFIGFQVEHQVKIKVLAIDNISDLADAILKERDTKILSFEWKPLEQVNNNQLAVKLGTRQGQQLCQQIGMKLSNIKNVEQIAQKGTQKLAVYKFQVQCSPRKKQSKKEGRSVQGKKQDTTQQVDIKDEKQKATVKKKENKVKKQGLKQIKQATKQAKQSVKEGGKQVIKQVKQVKQAVKQAKQAIKQTKQGAEL